MMVLPSCIWCGRMYASAPIGKDRLLCEDCAMTPKGHRLVQAYIRKSMRNARYGVVGRKT